MLVKLNFNKCCGKLVPQLHLLKFFCSYESRSRSKLPEIEYDIEYLCSTKYMSEIEANIKNRKGIGNIIHVQALHNEMQNMSQKNEQSVHVGLLQKFKEEANRIPNKSHPLVYEYGESPRIVKVIGSKINYNFQPKDFSIITKKLNVIRTDNLSNLAGHKSYYFLGELAELEKALIQFTVKKLLSRNFKFISVPDILPVEIIERCGMITSGDRTQVYALDDRLYQGNLCLSGTAEMALAGYLMNQEYSEIDLPLRLAAVSRCYRAETSRMSEERGVYRVHQFTKVEMFGVTRQEDSSALLEEIRDLQEQIFTSLGLHFQILDMPAHELGASAYQKYDIEAWMPGRQMFGEVSSCSDCTDYQSRRLNIKYRPASTDTLVHAHTVNGTACAVPRMLIALLETHQKADGTIAIPEILQPFMKGKLIIGPQKNVPVMQFVKSKYRKENIDPV